MSVNQSFCLSDFFIYFGLFCITSDEIIAVDTALVANSKGEKLSCEECFDRSFNIRLIPVKTIAAKQLNSAKPAATATVVRARDIGTDLWSQ